MPDIAMRFNRDVLVLEGAMGTMLQRAGMSSDMCPEAMNVLEPDTVEDIHRYYHLAGADCAISNTFGGTRNKLSAYELDDRAEELNMAGVVLAGRMHPQHVLADMGPCGLVMEPLGSATFDEMYEQYHEQATWLAKAAPDAILIETMTDIADARCAVMAARDACDLPILCTCTFNSHGVMDLSGTTPAVAAVILKAAGASAIGMNCGLGPEELYPLFCQMAAASDLPLIIQPNAGIPTMGKDGNAVYPGTADQMGDWAVRYRAAGANLIGSCCGSTPAFTGAIAAAVGSTDVVPHAVELRGMVLAGPRRLVRVGGGAPVRIVGERINPTGKKTLAAELRQLSMSSVTRFATQEVEAGADILDVNVGAPEVDEPAALELAVKSLVGCVGVPLSIDTTNHDALERALKVFPGRALINSCNGSSASIEAVLPLARRYGAAVVCLALDDDGIPATAADRLKVVAHIREAAHAQGLSDDDLIVDSLVMTAATDAANPKVTLSTLTEVRKLGLATLLGVSNVSHGLPDRKLLNAAFADAAVTAGLDAGIVNPNDSVVMESIRNASLFRDAGGAEGHTIADAMARWDRAFQMSVEKAREGVEALSAAEDTVASDGAVSDEESGTPEQDLRRAVLRGDADGAVAAVDAVVAAGFDPTRIISDILTPAIQSLGDAFGRGEAFLPQMMVAADAMKAAVAEVKKHIPEGGLQATDAGRVVFCTVKGDIHSIGKDICISLLESQGFHVEDLGVDVDPQAIVDAASKSDADVVCLSALMTTTLPSMKATVELMHSKLPDVAVLVGGAVVTGSWADSIGAGFSDDAPSCVNAVRQAVESRGKRS